MEDVEFCREFVRRLERPIKTKTAGDMIRIVERNERLDPLNMFDDEAMKSLFKCNVNREVYSFIRDNQHLFLKDSHESNFT